MPQLHLALRGEYFLENGDPAWVALPSGPALPADFPTLWQTARAQRDSSLQTIFPALTSALSLLGTVHHQDLTLHLIATPVILHYSRLADGTVQPLSSDPRPLTLAPGDTYIALTSLSIDSPTLARFLHLRDYFNADKLATALLAHLAELNYASPTALLIIECR